MFLQVMEVIPSIPMRAPIACFPGGVMILFSTFLAVTITMVVSDKTFYICRLISKRLTMSH